jgi:hypothetical protein
VISPSGSEESSLPYFERFSSHATMSMTSLSWALIIALESRMRDRLYSLMRFYCGLETMQATQQFGTLIRQQIEIATPRD